MRDLTAGKPTLKLSDRIADVRGRLWPTRCGRSGCRLEGQESSVSGCWALNVSACSRFPLRSLSRPPYCDSNDRYAKYF